MYKCLPLNLGISPLHPMANKIARILLVVSTCWGTQVSIAQEYAAPLRERVSQKPWKWTQVDVALGGDIDRYADMSLQRLMAFARNPAELQRDLQNLDEEIITYATGVGLYANIGLSPLNRKTGTYRDDQELRLGIGIHSPKEAMVTYRNESMDTSIVYCNIHAEITLEAAYLFKYTLGKRFHWYWGVGANTGTTFANEMILMHGKYFGPGEHPSEQESHEMNQQTYRANPIVYGRVYVPYGIHYRIDDKWLVGLDMRTGIGWQWISNERTQFIRRTGVFALGAKYRL